MVDFTGTWVFLQALYQGIWFTMLDALFPYYILAMAVIVIYIAKRKGR